MVLPPEVAAAVTASDPSSNLHLVLRVYAGPRTDVDVDDPGVVRDVDVPEDLTR
ncbi:hypothetical protein D3C83_303460 [compost metagenome]